MNGLAQYKVCNKGVLISVKWMMMFIFLIVNGNAYSEPNSSELKQPVGNLKIISVTDYPFTLGDKPAVTISFGESDNQFCAVTIHRSAVNQGFSISSSQRDNQVQLSVECNWDGKYFIESVNQDTHSDFSILSIDKKQKIAKIKVSAKLVEASKLEEYFNLDGVEVDITGVNFDNLFKKPKDKRKKS